MARCKKGEHADVSPNVHDQAIPGNLAMLGVGQVVPDIAELRPEGVFRWGDNNGAVAEPNLGYGFPRGSPWKNFAPIGNIRKRALSRNS